VPLGATGRISPVWGLLERAMAQEYVARLPQPTAIRSTGSSTGHPQRHLQPSRTRPREPPNDNFQHADNQDLNVDTLLGPASGP
jgi:hypothetical protein